MDSSKTAQDVLAYLANEGIELSDDLGQAEVVVRELLQDEEWNVC